MGDSPKTQTTTTTSDWAPRYRPMADAGVKATMDFLMPGGAPRALPADAMYQWTAPTPEMQQMQQAAFGQAQRMPGFLQGGADALAATAGGAYLDPEKNPYLQQYADIMKRDMSDAYATGVSPQLAFDAIRTGNFGGSAANQREWQSRYGYGQSVGDAMTKLYGGAYDTERARQMQAIQAMPQMSQSLMAPYQWGMSIAEIPRGWEQERADIFRKNAMLKEDYPVSIMGRAAQLFNQWAGNSGSQITVGPNQAASK